MDITQIFLALLGIGIGVLGWFARVLYDATQSLRRDLSSLEVQLNRDYVRNDRLREAMADALKPITEGIKEIKEVLAHRIER